MLLVQEQDRTSQVTEIPSLVIRELDPILCRFALTALRELALLTVLAFAMLKNLFEFPIHP